MAYLDDLAVGLHFDGTNGSTTFTDEKGATVTAVGDVAISTGWAAPLTGNTASAYFGSSGTRGLLTLAANTAFNNFGTADFFIRFWLKKATVSQYRTLAAVYTSGGGNAWQLNIDGANLQFLAGAGYEIVITPSGNAITANGEHYIEVSRVSGTTRLFVDGAIIGSSTASASISKPSLGLQIGSMSSSSSGLDGYIDDFEIGIVGGHSTAYTRPTSPFGASGTSTGTVAPLALSVTVGALGTPALPLTVTSCVPVALVLPLAVSVLPAALLDGSQTVTVGSAGTAGQWTAVITLDGVDVTAKIVGEIRVDAEEGAARLAEFAIRLPAATVISLATWTGRAVTIDVADASTGTPRYLSRLFTGVVDTPSLNLPSRRIALRCTDDLQGRCNALDNAALLALIGGYTSPAVFDAAATGWAHAQDRLSTVAAALDIAPDGALRVTPWTAKATPDLTLDENWIADGSLAVQIAERSALVNEVTVDFAYRFPRVKAEAYRVEYEAVNMTNFAQFLLDDKWFMQRAQIVAAIEKAGGTVESITYTPLPNTIIAVGSGYFTPSAADAEVCMGFSALVSFDYTQTIEEQHAIRVFNQLSIDAVGYRRGSLSGALEGEYPDLVATESAIKLYKADVLANPPADQATASEATTTSVNATLTPETDRNAANAAMEALIAMAKVKIHASHRANRVQATVPLIPALDLDKTLRLDADGVTAQGKCVSVVHRLDPDAGTATSDIAIALCALAGAGIVHDDDAIAAPAGTSAGSTPLAFSATVTYNAGPTDDHVITVTFPQVEAAERANAEIRLPADVAAAIDEDLFTVALED